MVKVALLKVPDYSKDKVSEALTRGLALLEVDKSFFEGKKVLLKPNLLAPSSVDAAVVSHPVVVSTAASLVLTMGGEVTVGDSPGLGSAGIVAASSGLAGALKKINVPLINLEGKREVKYPEGRICKSFPLAAAVVEKDILVSVARLKTHKLTRYTGAVKNLFGCIPGRTKAEFHLRYHRLADFNLMLADLLGVVKPSLAVVDGIVSMEGEGPRRGSPRNTGFMLISKDAVAADAVACALVGIKIKEVPHLMNAAAAGLGKADLKDIEILGDSFEDLRVKGFKQVSGTSRLEGGLFPPVLAGFLRKFIVPYPHIQADKCRGCRVCVECCPPGVIEVKDNKASIRYNGCIRCYCCQELCPHGAVKLKRKVFLKKAKTN